VKAFWGRVDGGFNRNSINMIFQILGVDFIHFNMQALILILLGIVVVIQFFYQGLHEKRRRKALVEDLSNKKYLGQLILGISASLCVMGYVIFYAYSGPIQKWHTANLVVPIFIILVILGEYADMLIPNGYQQYLRIGVSIIVIGIFFRNFIVTSNIGSSKSPWPHQQIMLEAGKYLAQHNLEGKVGAWNAGIIGFYQGGSVVNIDGLVNDDIYPYIANNNLPIYLTQKRIQYIIDFEIMLTDKKARLKGGYDDVGFLNKLLTVKVFDYGQYEWKYLTLYKLTP
jgi:hypothetical protein